MYRSLLLPYKSFVIQNFCELCLQSYNFSCKYRQFSILNNVKKAIFDSLHVLKLKLEIKNLPVSFAVSGILLNFFGDKQSSAAYRRHRYYW